MKSSALIILVCIMAGCTSDLAAVGQSKKSAIAHPDLSQLSEPVNRALYIARRDWESDVAKNKALELAVTHATLAQIYLVYGFDDAALDAFDAALTLDPDNAQWNYLKGISYYRNRQLSAAIEQFSLASTLTDDSMALLRRAQCKVESGQWIEAKNDLQQLEQTESQSAVMFWLKARVAMAEAEYSDAQEALEQALKLQPQANTLYRPLAAAVREQGELSATTTALKKIGNEPIDWNDQYLNAVQLFKTSVQSYMDVGKKHIADRKYALATSAFDRAVQLGPSDVSARMSYGRSLEILGEPDAALSEYKAAIELQPNNALAHYFIGTFYERQQRYDEAQSHYLSATEFDNAHVPARLLLAHSLFRARNYSEASEHYRTITEIDDRHMLATYYLALSYVALDKCEQALPTAERLFKIKPNSGQVKEALARTIAMCSEDNDQLSLAIVLSEQLMDSQPDAESAQTMAMIYAANKDFEKARQYQELAIQRRGDKNSDALKDQLTHYLSSDHPPKLWNLDSPRFNPPWLTPSRSQ